MSRGRRNALLVGTRAKGRSRQPIPLTLERSSTPKDPAEQRRLGAFLLEAKAELHEVFFGALLGKMKADYEYTKIDQQRCMRLVESEKPGIEAK